MEQLSEEKKYQTATVDRLEGEWAVLVFDDGQSLRWPKKNLPADMKEGERVGLYLLRRAGEDEEREQLAKAVLNQLLKTD